MSYRWKIPELNAELVDPQGIRAAQQYAASQRIVPVASRIPENPYLPEDGTLAEMNRNSMEGYRPNSAMAPDGTGMNGYFRAQAAAPQGYVPNVADPQGARGQQPVELEGYGESLEAASRNADIRGQLQELQDEYDSVTAQIAALDRQYPGLKGMSGQRAEIAAQRASIGDMSAYDNMFSGSANPQQATNAIENALMDAEKLTWALDGQNEEDGAVAMNQIDVAMRKAERDASQAGIDVNSIPSYGRLKAALSRSSGNDGGFNANSLVNQLKWKQEKGLLTESDRKYIEEELKGKINSKDYDLLMGFWKDSKGKTAEAKNKAAQEKQAAEDAAKSWNKDRNTDEKKNEWNRLVKEKAPITKYYVLNAYGNPVPKGGAK